MKHVLIIDDDDLMRRAWTRYFKAHKLAWHVETAANVSEAVVAFCAPDMEYDLVVSDFDLQDSDGDGVHVLILARGSQPGAKRIMCSGNPASTPRIRDARGFEVIESFISKPFDTQIVDNEITRLLGEQLVSNPPKEEGS